MSFAGPSRLSSIAIQPLKTATRTPRSLVQQCFASNSRVLQNGVRPPSSPPLSKNLSKRPEGTVEAVSEDPRSVTEARLAVEDKFRRRVGRSAAKPPQRTSRLLAYIGWGGSISESQVPSLSLASELTACIVAAFWMILYEDFGPNEHVFSPVCIPIPIPCRSVEAD